MCLDAVPFADEVLSDLGTFDFFASQIFSVGRRHSSAVTDLLHLITRLEELHTEVQGTISSPHLAMTPLFDVSQWCSLYLNRCVAALVSASIDAPGVRSPYRLSQSWLVWRGVDT